MTPAVGLAEILEKISAAHPKHGNPCRHWSNVVRGDTARVKIPDSGGVLFNSSRTMPVTS